MNPTIRTGFPFSRTGRWPADSLCRARFQGEGKLCGRLLTQDNGEFLLEHVPSRDWWTTCDLVRLEGRFLTFLRRADRLVKILGELVDPDAVQEALQRRAPGAVVEAHGPPARRRGTGGLRSFHGTSERSFPRME